MNPQPVLSLLLLLLLLLFTPASCVNRTTSGIHATSDLICRQPHLPYGQTHHSHEPHPISLPDLLSQSLALFSNSGKSSDGKRRERAGGKENQRLPDSCTSPQTGPKYGTSHSSLFPLFWHTETCSPHRTAKSRNPLPAKHLSLSCDSLHAGSRSIHSIILMMIMTGRGIQCQCRVIADSVR